MLSKTLLNFVVVIFILSMSFEAVAQSDIALATRVAKLQALANSLMQRDAADRAQAQAFSRRTGIAVRRELPNGKILELQRFSQGLRPIFYVTNNLDAADSVSTLKVWPGGSAGLDLDGSGMTVGEWDGGAIYAHTDFIGRLTQMDGATTVSGHSTHVAGTLIGAGDGLEPRSRGMAYAAQLNAWDWNSDTAEMAAAAAGGLLASNHSYGIAAGWIYIGDVPPNTWWWIGGAADTDVEDPYFGYYDTQSQLWDQIAFDAPYYLIVKASGNDRSDTGPSPGEEYTVIDQDGNPLFTSTLPRNFDCAPAGYDCLPTNSVAKNVLTVGAVDDVPGGYSVLAGPSQVQMAPFSSWGPTDDGRIKPDVVGNGVFLISAWPDFPFYAAAAGTSMSAPNVTGSLLLLQQHYENIHGVDSFMRSSTLKALAIHTADESGSNDGPDYAFGWGLLNTKNAAKVISEDGGGDHQIIEGTLANGATNDVQFNVSQADSVLKVTVVWMDPPGTPVTPLTLDAPTLMLKNDLDLRITRGPSTYLPWVLDPANPSAAATTGDNFRDNVEQVVVNGGGTGTYTISVSHKGTLLNGTSQNYSLIISVIAALPTGSSLLIDEDFSGGLPAGWSVDTVMGIPWTIKSPVPGDSRLGNGTGGVGNFAMVDNGYAYQSVTSLRTPTMDLSSASAAVLRFKSYYIYDFLESLNVDVSTDGGTVWSTVWFWQGFNPFPTLYTLDLSGSIAGHANVMLRFRFDSEGWIDGDLWQIDDVELDVFGATPPPGDPPGQATSPNPADGSSGLALDTTLSWSTGSLTTSHEVYFGTDSTPDANEYEGSQTGTSFDPGLLSNDTTYFWRVDEINAEGATTGNTWSFTTEASPPPLPNPTIHLASLQGVGVPARRGRWNAVVTITVTAENGSAAAGVLAEGSWSNGSSGSDSCTTDGSGECSISKLNLKGSVASVDFTVGNLSATDFDYDSGGNQVPVITTVFKDDPNLLPNAVDDSFTTPVNTQLQDNVLGNDDPGDGVATATASGTSVNGFTVTMIATSGDFTYTPTSGFVGTDSFGYTITDNSGDMSSAIVSITVGNPPVDRSVTATKSKNKGNNMVSVSWGGFQDGSVTISVNGAPQATGGNSGSWEDNLGKKPSGTYVYEVCEAGPSTACVSDSVSY